MFFKNRNRDEGKERIILDEKMDQQELELTVKNIKGLLSINSDVKFRQIYINGDRDLTIHFIYIEGFIDINYISNYVLKPLMQEKEFKQAKNLKEVAMHIDNGRLYSISQKKVYDINEAINLLISGTTLIVIDSERVAFSINAKNLEKRAITEPTGENVIKGAKDAFVETLKVNTSICRRKIKSHNLTIEEIKVGEQSRTSIAVIYMNNIANKSLIDEVKKRLNSIDIDRVITSFCIEESIADDQHTAFPQILYTERPDKFCENIIEGRIGILIDGLPISFIAPGVLLQYMQAPEDYSQNYIISSFIVFMRFSAMALTLVLPAFYTAITSFHHEMIPTDLISSIASAKEGVPFPMFLEVIMILIAFEVLVEAGLRFPKTIGHAVSIVGALVVGQSAVEAKLLSPTTVVVIAITAISSFTMPNQDFSNALRLWRFILVICSSIIGIFGLVSGLIFLLYHLCRLESFGVPYLSPFVKTEVKQLYDTILRFPLNKQRKRPMELRTINQRRMK